MAIPKIPTRESHIEAYLVKCAKAAGGEVRKVQWVGRSSAPDRVVMQDTSRRPSTIWVELKAPGKKPEPHQLREHERMRRVGQRVEVIDSYEGVDALFK